jgi:hypothetical protein
MQMRILSAADVAAAVDMRAAIGAMRAGFAAPDGGGPLMPTGTDGRRRQFPRTAHASERSWYRASDVESPT